jgi:hypothetical protein
MLGGKPARNLVSLDAPLAYAIFFASLTWFLYSWIFTQAGWLQIELLGTADALFSKRDSLAAQLSTVLDWHLWDDAQSTFSLRLRVVSDFVEVIDAAFRPRLTWLTGLRPSVSLTSVPMALATIAAFFLAVRRVGLARPFALLLTAVFISTIGFQSCFVAYIRPAKRITLLAFCLAVWLILRCVQEKREKDILWILLLTEIASLADETGLLLFVAAIVYLGWAATCREMRPRALLILGLFPLVHLVVAYGILPYLYALGPYGIRPHTLSGPDAAHIISGVIDPAFYRGAFSNLISVVFATLGAINWHQATVVALVGGLCLILVRPRLTGAVGCAAVILICCVFFVSIIHRYGSPAPTYSYHSIFTHYYHIIFSYYPHHIFTYYYHSIVAAAVLFLIASIASTAIRNDPWFAIASSMVASAVIVSNFINFAFLNELWQRFHIYPIEPAAIVSIRDELRKNPKAVIDIMVAPSEIASPMGTEDYARRLVRAFYPDRDPLLTRMHDTGSAPASVPAFPYIW